MMPTSKKLLIRLSSAGDLILTSPLLKIIRDREPDSEIHFVVKSKYSDLIRYNPNIAKIHLVQEHSGISELKQLLKTEKFDHTMDLQNNFRSIYLRNGTSKKIHVIRKEVIKRAALVKMKWNFYSAIRSVALKYAQVYDRSINHVPNPEIFFPAEIKNKVMELWSSSGLKNKSAIFLCPAARHFTKRWPLENWALLAKMLNPDNDIFLVGGKEDTEMCEAIAKAGGACNFSGQLSMLESAALLSHADLVITNDSFLMHASNALGKKILAIFGSTVKEFGFFPYGVKSKIMEVNGLNCRPCSHIGKEFCPEKHFRCMLETTPKMVYETAMDLLKA